MQSIDLTVAASSSTSPTTAAPTGSPSRPGVTHVFTTTGSDLRWRAELTADPLWPRTPVVNSLRIEYSTQIPYADDYEAG